MSPESQSDVSDSRSCVVPSLLIQVTLPLLARLRVNGLGEKAVVVLELAPDVIETSAAGVLLLLSLQAAMPAMMAIPAMSDSVRRGRIEDLMLLNETASYTTSFSRYPAIRLSDHEGKPAASRPSGNRNVAIQP